MNTALIKTALVELRAKLLAITEVCNGSVTIGERENARYKIGLVDKELDELNATVNSAHLLLVEGGEWLGNARNWIQRKFSNGERVTWGSSDILEGRQVRVSDIEELAAIVAASAIIEYKLGRLKIVR